jgi:hypothetical protein
MIAELRDRLAADLAAVLDRVEAQPPSRLTPPIVYLVPAEPYVSAGQTFGDYVISVDVHVVVRTWNLTEIEKIIGLVLANTTDWALTAVDAPGPVTVSGLDHYGTIIHLAKAARLNGGTP